MPIIGIIGPMRSGKTLIATHLAVSAKLPIYANYDIEGMTRKVSAKELGDAIKVGNTDWMAGAVIVVDEAHVEIDSRSAMSAANKLISYLVLQTGKLRTTLIWTSQHWSQAELRLRIHTDTRIDVRRVVETPQGVMYAQQGTEPEPWAAVITNSRQTDNRRGMVWTAVSVSLVRFKDVVLSAKAYATAQPVFPKNNKDESQSLFKVDPHDPRSVRPKNPFLYKGTGGPRGL